MYYGNADGFKTYHEARGKQIAVEWTDEKIESALLVSSEWLDSKYTSLWVGFKTDGYLQEREWPRTNATVIVYPYYTFPINSIPEQIMKATYEAAFRQLTDNSLQVDFTPNKYSSVRVEGAVSVDYNPAIYSASDAQTEIPVIKALMQDLLCETATSPLSGGVLRG